MALKQIPFEFVLEELHSLSPTIKPMFGCHAVYIKNKIVLILRDRESSPSDNGVWLATTVEHHDSLKKDFPPLRSIKVFETPVTGWQVLPVSDPQFEKLVVKACAMVLKGDPRIGKIPKSKTNSRRSKKK